ncbi:MAG: hypothetical protein WCT32_02790 [Patescibacteria group bacterium]|jgi:hypothetical protein
MSKSSKRYLNIFRMAFFREKYRFDQGNAFLVFFNFSLLVISVVKQYGGSQSSIPIYVTAGLLGTWFLGYVLDRFIKVQDAQERVALKRSPIWKENFDRQDEHNKTLREAIQRLEDLEALIRGEITDDESTFSVVGRKQV